MGLETLLIIYTIAIAVIALHARHGSAPRNKRKQQAIVMMVFVIGHALSVLMFDMGLISL